MADRRRGEQVTIYREAFLNGDAELRRDGERLDCDWDVDWATVCGKALYWFGMMRGTEVYHHGKLVFVAGQTEAPAP